jgi:hypothetical protein
MYMWYTQSRAIAGVRCVALYNLQVLSKISQRRTLQTRFILRFCSNVNQGIFRGGGGRVYVTYLQALKLLANPPLQATDNGARSQFIPIFV